MKRLRAIFIHPKTLLPAELLVVALAIVAGVTNRVWVVAVAVAVNALVSKPARWGNALTPKFPWYPQSGKVSSES